MPECRLLKYYTNGKINTIINTANNDTVKFIYYKLNETDNSYNISDLLLIKFKDFIFKFKYGDDLITVELSNMCKDNSLIFTYNINEDIPNDCTECIKSFMGESNYNDYVELIDGVYTTYANVLFRENDITEVIYMKKLKQSNDTQIINVQSVDPKKLIEKKKDISKVGFTEIKKAISK